MFCKCYVRFRVFVFIFFGAIVSTWSVNSSLADVVQFEDLPVPGGLSASGGFNNGDVRLGSPYRDPFTVLSSGDDGFGGNQTQQSWASDGVDFGNTFTYYDTFDYWSGWSWSNRTDTTTAGFTNQYASWAGGGSDGSGGFVDKENYAVAFGSGAYFNLPSGAQLQSIDISNTTYAALSMMNGDSIAKKFGGVSGNDPDYFRVNLLGYDGIDVDANLIGTVSLTLADYTFADNSLDYILDSWSELNLAAISGSRQIRLSYESSDSGNFGVNTPTYIAVDNLRFAAVPEPHLLGLLVFLAGIVSVVERRRDE